MMRRSTTLLQVAGCLPRSSAVVLAFAALPGSLAAQREINPDCALLDGRFRVELAHEGVCCPKELVFLVQGRDEPVARELRLEAQLEKIYTVRLLADSCLVTTGRRHRAGNVILVQDLVQDRPPMEIWSYHHRFSPSRRKLVYSTFYQPDAPPEERRSILMLLDFDAARAGEAEAEAPGAGPEEPSHNPGQPIYPPANARQNSFDSRLEDPHVLQSPILWSAEEDRIVFLERSRGAPWLVEVVVVAGEIETRRRRLGADDVGGVSEAQAAPLIALELRWRGDREVEARFSGEREWRPLSLPAR